MRKNPSLPSASSLCLLRVLPLAMFARFTKTASHDPPPKNEATDVHFRPGPESIEVFLPLRAVATLCLPAGRIF